MRVIVFGAGAVGSLLGGLLSREHDVTLVAREAHANAIRRRGLRISGITEYVARPVATTAVPREEFDVAMVTTKAYDTAGAVNALQTLWRRSVFVTLQNGLGNAEHIAARVDRVAAGTTSHGVTFVAPGEIVHAGTGDTVLGPVKGIAHEDVRRIADALTGVGVSTSVVADVHRELWTKAIVNAAINPLTAVLRVQNGDLVGQDDLRSLLARLAGEGAAAARAAGVDVDGEAAAAKAEEVARRTAGNRSSMLQDVERGRRTEIEAITGELLRAAAAKGVDLPLNATLYALVRGLERSPHPG